MDDFEKQVEQEETDAQSEQQPEYQAPEGPDAGFCNDVVEKIKDLVKKGNITKIVIKKGENVLVNIPLNVGIVGGIIGVAAAPWAIVAAAVATAGFDCVVELVKDDGEVVNLGGKVMTTVKNVGSAVVDGVKDAVRGSEPEQAPAEEEPPTVDIPVEDGNKEE